MRRSENIREKGVGRGRGMRDEGRKEREEWRGERKRWSEMRE